MDYTASPFLFKVKKVLRYVRLYGPSRTSTKVKSQLHMKKTEGFEGDTWVNPRGSDCGDVAIVGCGNFSFSTIAYYISNREPRVRNILFILIITPFCTNFIVRTFAWMIILREGGIVNTLLMKLRLISEPLQLLKLVLRIILGKVFLIPLNIHQLLALGMMQF